MGDMVMTVRDRQNVSTGVLDAQEGILQRRLDFTPAASELAQALRNRETRAQKMLARLRLGPCTTFDLMMLGGAGFSSRLKELRRAGHEITVEGGPERFVYTLKKA